MSEKPVSSTRVPGYERTRLAAFAIEKSYELQNIKRRGVSLSLRDIDLFYEGHCDSGRHLILHYSALPDSRSLIRSAQEVQAGEPSDFWDQGQLPTGAVALGSQTHGRQS